MLFPPEDKFETTWQVGVTATVNLGAFPAVERRVAEAQAEAGRLRAQREARVMQVTLEVTESAESVRRARERIPSATAALAFAEESLRVIQGKRAAGLARATELLDGELELMRARLDASRAAADLRIGDAALRRALGLPPQAAATGRAQ
jgi:outer membrane protein TolC